MDKTKLAVSFLEIGFMGIMYMNLRCFVPLCSFDIYSFKS